MHTRHILHARRTFALLALLVGAFCLNAAAQTPSAQAPQQPTVVPPAQRNIESVATEVDRFCGGFIEHEPAAIRFQIVGGEEEQEQRVFSQGDYLYINAGAQQGIAAGQDFAILRPRGRFTSKFTRKKGTLGVFTQEVGRLRVIEVKDNISVAFVLKSCEVIRFGDILRSVPQPASVTTGTEFPIRRFQDPTGKQQGRIVMARDGREMFSENQVVYVDLGREDNLRVGDVLTIYRPVGRGNLTRQRIADTEIAPNKKNGFESEVFAGGKFSNQANRAKDPNGTGFHDQTPITTPEIRDRRPALPRKIVGEAVVLNVEARTATVLITHVAQELHTGDYVEVR